MLRKQHWLQTHHSCHHHLVTHPIPDLRDTWGGPWGATPPHAPTWYLLLAASSSPSLSQVTMGLGFPNAMQVRVTLLPSFASTYCGGVSVKVGGAGGQRETPSHPPGPTRCHPRSGTVTELRWPHTKWGHPLSPHLPKKGALKCKRGSGCGDSSITGAVPSVPYSPEVRGRAKNPWRAPRGASPFCTLLPSGSLCGFPPRFPSHINLLLSKHEKTPQCRSKGSFLIKEAGRITARP